MALLRYAVEELGVDFFDTAEAYQAKDPESGKILWNEEMLGKAAKATFQEKLQPQINLINIFLVIHSSF